MVSQERSDSHAGAVLRTSFRYEIPSSSVASPIRIPTELRIGSALRRRTLVTHRWLPQQKRIEESKDSRGGFDLIDTPRAMGLSHDKICIGYRKSYTIMNLTTGMIISELPIATGHEPVINCLQDRTQWCVQMDTSTVFLNSDFEPLYKNGVVWKDVPSGIVQASPYVLALMNQSIDICTFNGSQSVPVQQIPHKGLSAIGKCRLWMDAQTQRIYSGTTTDMVVLEPISVPIQLQNYMGTYKYDLALILIRAVLGMSMTSSVNDGPRNADGHARGNLDLSTIPKDVVFSEEAQPTNRVRMAWRFDLNGSISFSRPRTQSSRGNHRLAKHLAPIRLSVKTRSGSNTIVLERCMPFNYSIDSSSNKRLLSSMNFSLIQPRSFHCAPRCPATFG